MGKEFKYPKVIIFHALDSEREKIITPALTKFGMVGDAVWVAKTGVGKVGATLMASTLLSRFAEKNTLCVNVGVCGGSPATKDAPCVVIDRVYNNDFDHSVVSGLPFEKPLFNLSKRGEGIAKCFTQDHFVTDLCDVQESVGNPDPNGKWYVDMELFGLAAACSALGFKLVAIKSVSDVVGADKQTDEYCGDGFDTACDRASKMLADFLSHTLGDRSEKDEN